MDELGIRFARIRAYYATVRVDMNRGDLWPGDPYDWDRPYTGIVMTPIEWSMWQELRAEDVVMLPQYPVGRYFVDFGNPAEKVAIECDGAQWHTDGDKDLRRQVELEGMGWTIYRISGRNCLSQRATASGRNEARELARRVADRFDIRHGCRGSAGSGRPLHVSEALLEAIRGW